jgi:putative restriction endonuclease
MARVNWTREELIVAFNLYCKIPFGRIHNRNPEIISLADALGRTPSAVSYKLANFARLDPALQARGIQGAGHGSKSEEEVWKEFHGNWEALAYESESLLARMKGVSIERSARVDISDVFMEGKERESVVRVRVNQNFFRLAVLTAYDYRCCVSGIAVTELLNASHIVPWAADAANRVNPRNGLCLNALLDRAFDRGLITVTPEYHVRISASLTRTDNLDPLQETILRYHGQKIHAPGRFAPEPTFLLYHNNQVFRD